MTSPTPTEPAEYLRGLVDMALVEHIGGQIPGIKWSTDRALDAIMALFSSRLEAVEGERDAWKSDAAASHLQIKKLNAKLDEVRLALRFIRQHATFELTEGGASPYSAYGDINKIVTHALLTSQTEK